MNGIKINLSVALFDFDGTLVNTTPLILKSFRATWLEAYGLVFDDSDYINTFGMLLPSALKLLLEKGSTEKRFSAPADIDAKAAELLQIYRTFNLKWHDEMIEPIEGMKETLMELKSRGLKLGVVSSKMRPGVERGLELFGMTEFFDSIICAEDVVNHKPHPEPLLLAVERLQTTRGETVYIGDSIHDIVAGRAAGVKTAAATWGPFPRAQLESFEPDFLLYYPGDILMLFSD